MPEDRKETPRVNVDHEMSREEGITKPLGWPGLGSGWGGKGGEDRVRADRRGGG